MSDRPQGGRPSDRPERHPVWVYGGPSTITRGVKDMPAWYAKYHPAPPSDNISANPQQQQQQQQQSQQSQQQPSRPSLTSTSPTDEPSLRPRHASTGSIDSSSSSSSPTIEDTFRARRSSSGSSNILPSISPTTRPEPNPAQRRDSMGRLFSGLTTQKRESHAGEEGWRGRRESWDEQRPIMGGGMSRALGGWWGGVVRGEGQGGGKGGEGGK
ncbi:hypothetical protein FQN54_007336 [Arachnomyces sp. PD_36]|nr:hypothetical protein FQN54_007336 [Arachnomyces sp. PD_36]